MTAPLDPERFVRTDLVEDDVALAAARGGAVQLGAQAVRIAMFAVSGVVLARLLTPEDFGLMGMVAAVVAVVAVVRDFGFPMAAVHRQGLRHAEVSALFWVSLKLNVALTLLVALSAPLLARFYGEPKLIGITLVLAAASFVSSLGSQHESLLIRQMRFGTIRAIELGSTFVSLIVGIVFAVAGAGYWALVAQAVVLGVAQVMLLWSACGWRPARRLARPGESTEQLGEFFKFGREFTMVRALRHLARNADRIVVGYVGGAAQLGFYDNGARWAMYPVLQVERPLEAVAVAGLSRLRDDREAYRLAARRGIAPVLVVGWPLLAFLALEADEVIPLLLGEQWRDAVPVFRIICVAAIADLLSRTTTWLYLSSGETQRQLRFELAAFPVMVGAVLVGAAVEGGAIGVASGVAVAAWALAVPRVAICLLGSSVRVADYVAAVWRPLVATGTGVLTTLGIEMVLGVGADPSRIAVGAVAFTTGFVASWRLLPGGRRATEELLGLIRLAVGGRRLGE